MTEREKQLEQQVRELAEELERISKAPNPTATVLQIDPPYVRLATMSGIVSVEAPKKPTLKPGDTVRITDGVWSIVDTTAHLNVGAMYSISRIDDAKQIFIRDQSEERLVINGLDKMPEVGDVVLCDPTKSVIIKIMDHQDQMVMHEDIGVKWDDIVGCADAKQELREAITMPQLSSNVLKAYGYKPPKGILLYGPPGCGKTMLAKAGASEIAKLNNKRGAGGFIYVKGPQLFDPYVGVTEAKIRELFIKAREFKRKHGIPALIFIDEADALLGTRGDNSGNPLDKTVVPMFLAEMDGLEESGALVLLSTNRPDTLDPAITREGRIDKKIGVTRPTREDTEKLIAMLLKMVPIAKGFTPAKLAELAAKELFAGDRQFAMIEYEGGRAEAFNLSDIVSGAMITALVDNAKQQAWRRDMKDGKQISGVMPADIIAAVDKIYEGNKKVDHRDAIMTMAGEQQITSVRFLHAEAA